MSVRLHHGRLVASITDVLDAGIDLIPHFEMAAIPVLDNAERPGEWPAIRRRLRAEGIRALQHRGVLLLPPGELDRLTAAGLFNESNELMLCSEFNEEFEGFPGRISTDHQNFTDGTPLGLEEWMLDAGCLLALGDGDGLNFATPDADLAERLRVRFKPVRT
jgi:hypothetical protein